MKIGIIADIHANVFGLRAVLNKLQDVDTILCAGDITGYYSFVNEVFDEIKNRDVKFIRGNHDSLLLRDILPKNSLYSQSIIYTRANIAPSNLKLIEQTGKSLKINIDGLDIVLFHGSPWGMEYIYPD